MERSILICFQYLHMPIITFCNYGNALCVDKTLKENIVNKNTISTFLYLLLKKTSQRTFDALNNDNNNKLLCER